MPSEPVYDTLDVLSAITVRGPDAGGLLWVPFQSAALAKAAIERAQPRTDKKE
jgi:hypothetical protein